MSRKSVDIETNLTHDTIWCGWFHDVDTGETEEFRNAQEFVYGLAGVTELWHWHGLGFELPVIERVWGVTIDPAIKQVDGLVLSRLVDPKRPTGHSLESYGKELGFPKLEFAVEDFDKGYTEKMSTYCKRDAELNTAAVKHIQVKLARESFSEASADLEHQVQSILVQQNINGFKLDIPHASNLYADLTMRMRKIEQALQERFPPIVTERVSEKTGKRLKDDVEEFNIGSRQQIAKRLESIGAKFPNKTEKGNIIIDEPVLEAIDLPEAKLVLEYLTLQKRMSQVNSWLECVGEDGRVHGRVNGNGAVTGRMTHSQPNMAQITSARKYYGKECRQCWVVDEGNKLVGIDASGLELRMLAHYMKDPEYTKEVVEGDVHTKNQHAAGLPDRDTAKTFIYAFLYGAGNEKIGSIVGKGAREGGKLKKSFLEAVPALKRLIDLTQEIAEANKSVPGLDGRRIKVRHIHAALNTLLQGAGAVVMKKAMVLFAETCERPYKQVAVVHDELQIECAAGDAEYVGECCAQAIRDAGVFYNMRCPLDAEYNIGNSWAETH